jgi:hypothetical protein
VKQDIQPLENALDSLLSLRGRIFHYKDPSMVGASPGLCRGFVAQEVEPVFPEWVAECDGYKTLNIRGFEALAVESLREVSARNDTAEAEIASLRADNDALKQRVARLEAMQQEVADLKAALARLASGK